MPNWRLSRNTPPARSSAPPDASIPRDAAGAQADSETSRASVRSVRGLLPSAVPRRRAAGSIRAAAGRIRSPRASDVPARRCAGSAHAKIPAAFETAPPANALGRLPRHCRRRPTSWILPLPRLAFLEPLDRRGDAFLASLLPLGFCDPFDVFPLMTGAEGCERCAGLLVRLQL
jgi:hypothetical protein